MAGRQLKMEHGIQDDSSSFWLAGSNILIQKIFLATCKNKHLDSIVSSVRFFGAYHQIKGDLS